MVQNNEFNQQGDQIDQRAEKGNESTEKMSAEVQKAGSAGSYNDCKSACEKEIGAPISKWDDAFKEATQKIDMNDPKSIEAAIEKNNKMITALQNFLKQGPGEITKVEERAKQQELLALEARKNGMG